MRIAAGVIGIVMMVIGGIFIAAGLAPKSMNYSNGNPNLVCLSEAQRQTNCSFEGDTPQEITQSNGASTRNAIAGAAGLVAGAGLVGGAVAAGGRREQFLPPPPPYPVFAGAGGPPPNYPPAPGGPTPSPGPQGRS